MNANTIKKMSTKQVNAKLVKLGADADVYSEMDLSAKKALLIEFVTDADAPADVEAPEVVEAPVVDDKINELLEAASSIVVTYKDGINFQELKHVGDGRFTIDGLAPFTLSRLGVDYLAHYRLRGFHTDGVGTVRDLFNAGRYDEFAAAITDARLSQIEAATRAGKRDDFIAAFIGDELVALMTRYVEWSHEQLVSIVAASTLAESIAGHYINRKEMGIFIRRNVAGGAFEYGIMLRNGETGLRALTASFHFRYGDFQRDSKYGHIRAIHASSVTDAADKIDELFEDVYVESVETVLEATNVDELLQLVDDKAPEAKADKCDEAIKTGRTLAGAIKNLYALSAERGYKAVSYKLIDAAIDLAEAAI